jgi:hypothetical protein
MIDKINSKIQRLQQTVLIAGVIAEQVAGRVAAQVATVGRMWQKIIALLSSLGAKLVAALLFAAHFILVFG